MTYKQIVVNPPKAYFCDRCESQIDTDKFRVPLSISFIFGRRGSSISADEDDRHLCMRCATVFLKQFNYDHPKATLEARWPT